MSLRSARTGNSSPGQGCTPEACSFRDHHAELVPSGRRCTGCRRKTRATSGRSSSASTSRSRCYRNANLELTRALRLPTFEVAGQVLIKRLTFLVRAGQLEHVWYPIFPPDEHAEEVVTWLRVDSLPRA